MEEIFIYVLEILEHIKFLYIIKKGAQMHEDICTSDQFVAIFYG